MLNVKEVFQTNWNQSKISVKQDLASKNLEISEQNGELESEKRDYLKKWLNMVQDMI